MKILVTGASGFVGSHLVAYLSTQGHLVEAWSLQGEGGDSRVLHRSVDLLHEALPPPEHGAWEVVYHLAAHTRPNIAWSSELVLENVTFCGRVLEHLLVHAPKARFVLASSAHVYRASDSPHLETDPCDPRSPYGMSKRLCEVWALSLRDKLDIQIMRSFNLLGPRMAKGLLLTDLVARVERGESPIRLHGRDDVKDFLDIRDAILAYAALLKLDAPSGSCWNLCSGQPTRVSELVQGALERLGSEAAFEFATKASQRMTGDSSRLQMASGWRPRFRLDDMLGHALGVPRG